MDINLEGVKPCPFCESTGLSISDKTTRINHNRRRHVAVYCRFCNTYGPRVLSKEREKYPHTAPQEAIEEAIKRWNYRGGK